MNALTGYKDNCGFGLLASIKNIPSYQNTDNAITALSRMIHRGAIAADGKSGDGSGLLFSTPDRFMRRVAKDQGVDLPQMYAIAVLFLSNKEHIATFEEYCEKNDLKIVFYRDVPVDKDALGEFARQTLPNIVHAFVVPNSIIATKRFDALLYLTRKEMEHAMKGVEGFYIPSFSQHVISYKGLVLPTHIKEFYVDLKDKDFETSFALFHQRFSTNTLPQWRLAQPFRAIAHNGEINSIEANRFSVTMKSDFVKSEIFTDDEMKRMMPILEENVSDSASLDNTLEFLLANDMDFFKAVRALVPAPWQNAPHMDGKLRSFYEYTSTCFEAWDGPAAVSVTNGRYIGCVLDRNGLRPSKYIVTHDDHIVISSEYGVLDIDPENIRERGRLQSGQMIGLDLKAGRIFYNEDINEYLMNSQPYSDWLNNNMAYLQEFVQRKFTNLDDYKYSNLISMQRYHNITNEVIEQVIKPMSETGKENTGSMGDDTPLAAFSDVQRNFVEFFKQKFAQVTNPPIDPIRESVVMSLNTGYGRAHNMLDESPDHAVRLKTISPILFKEKLDILCSFGDEKSPRYNPEYKFKTFYTGFMENLKESLEALASDIIESVRHEGIRTVILDDRVVSAQQCLIPMPMAVGYINNRLLEEGLRGYISIIAITGEVQDPHGAAVLLGFGVNAIYPYLLYATIVNIQDRDERSVGVDDVNLTLKMRLKNVQDALNMGLLKIMSKMGISTVASYRNSALFDTIGLSKEIVAECFKGSAALISGLCYSDIEERIRKTHAKAFQRVGVKPLFPLDIGGFYKHVERNGEYHDYSPHMVNAIHKASITGTKEDYQKVKELVEGRGLKFVRDFFAFNSERSAIDVKDVEPASEILKRFASAAMSMGSISEEAHEALAEAMNRIGAQSNSGEGVSPWYQA